MKSKIKSSPPFLLPDWAKEPKDGLPQAPPPFILPDWAKDEMLNFEQEATTIAPKEPKPENPLLIPAEQFWMEEANS